MPNPNPRMRKLITDLRDWRSWVATFLGVTALNAYQSHHLTALILLIGSLGFADMSGAARVANAAVTGEREAEAVATSDGG